MLYSKTMHLEGRQVTGINDDLDNGLSEPRRPGEVVHEFNESFKDGTRMRLTVKAHADGGCPVLDLYLLNKKGEELRHSCGWPSPIDQEYELEHAKNVYRLTIERGAYKELTATHAEDFIRGGGVRCPHCGCDDITGGRLLTKGGAAFADYTCSACLGVFQPRYMLVEVLAVSPPTQNIVDYDAMP